MTHSLSHTNDLRKKYPTFTRNIAISTGSYINDYNDEYGLTTGGLLYYRKKSAFLFSTEIKLWASKYSTTQHQNLLQYNSI